MRTSPLPLLLLLLTSCGDSKSARSPEAGSGIDLAVTDLAVTDRAMPDRARPDSNVADAHVADAHAADRADVVPSDGAHTGAPPAPPTADPPPRPPSTADVAAASGLRWRRGLIHMHSVHSHDACDGNPKPDGQYDQQCLADLRFAICNARLDYLLLTDHPDSFDDVTFDEAVLFDSTLGDVLIKDDGGATIGNVAACPDGTTVLIAPGCESDLMPVLLRRRPDDPSFYGQRTVEGVLGLKAAGALVLQAHTEERTFEELDPIGLDGIEIYNLHANVNPRWHQLAEVLPDISRLLDARDRGPHPDLFMLAILRENRWAIETWNRLVTTRTMLGHAGSDIHQNLPPLVVPSDGERLDSYRRFTTWFANYLLVDAASAFDLDVVREALATGRNLVVFHLLGEPDGFDFSGRGQDGLRIEMGAERSFEAGLTLRVNVPKSVPAAELDVRLLQIVDDGEGVQSVVVAQGSSDFSYAVERPGVYRVEVHQTPIHLAPELGILADLLVRPTPWIYSNPIYVR